MRKRVPLALASLTLLGLAAGMARAAVEAEAIPDDIIKQAAPVLAKAVQEQIPTPPIKVDPDIEKAQGMHALEAVGVVILPDRMLNDKSVADSKDKKTPAGLLLTRNLSVEKDGVGIGGEKLATVEVVGLGKAATFFLDVKGDKEEGRTLELYSKKDDEPLATTPLKKKDGEAKPNLVVKLTNIDPEKKVGDVVFSFPGGYEATVKLAYVEP